MRSSVSILCRRPAMAAWFEIRLAGDDAEHLEAVGEAALDEVTRIEQLLSRFDRSSEISRLNREAAQRPLRVDLELFAILRDCERWFSATDGFFDICIQASGESPAQERQPLDERVVLDAESRSVRFRQADVRLDLGAYGKGYALDRAARVLDAFNVDSALLHGGTSSILVRGMAEDGQPWRVAIRDPFAESAAASLLELPLPEGGLSSSAALEPGSARSDIINPLTAQPLSRQAACTVLAPTATEAEVLSTALLAMGRKRAGVHCCRRLPADRRVVWIDRESAGARLAWLATGQQREE